MFYIILIAATTLMTDEQQITALYERMYTAMIEKDESTLREVHADDFVLVHMTGMEQSREQYIRYILNGTLNYFLPKQSTCALIFTATKRCSPDTAAYSRVNAAVFGGGRHTWRLQLFFHLRRENGSWRFTRAEASTY